MPVLKDHIRSCKYNEDMDPFDFAIRFRSNSKGDQKGIGKKKHKGKEKVASHTMDEYYDTFSDDDVDESE